MGVTDVNLRDVEYKLIEFECIKVFVETSPS
jgi:hypothetical protein